MSCAQRCAVLGFGLMLAAASTEARELEFSVESRIAGDSNVFRKNSDQVADGFHALSPRVVVREANSKLNYLFSYRPTYETYFKTSGIDGFDHRARGDLSWRPTAVDTFGLTGNFTSSRNLRIEDQSGPSNPAPSLEESDRERIQRSGARFSYDRALSEVLSVQVSATFDDLTFSRNTSIDSRAFSGQLSTQYVLNPITAVGLFGTFSARENRGSGSQFTTETEIWNLAASFQRALTPTLNISAQAGPSFIRTKQISPVPAFPDTESQSTSYFAAVVLDKTWPRSDFKTSYTRSESSGGGSASSSINDNVTLDFNHRISRHWSLRIFGSWLQSKEIEEVPVPGIGNQDRIQFRALVRATRRITRHLSVAGQFSFFTQDQDESAGSESIGEIFSGFLSLQYTFDPVVF